MDIQDVLVEQFMTSNFIGPQNVEAARKEIERLRARVKELELESAKAAPRQAGRGTRKQEASNG